MPDYNPYTIRKCQYCDIAKGKRKFDFIPTNMLCEGCAIIHKCYNDLSKSETAVLRKHYMREMEPLLRHSIEKTAGAHTFNVGFSTYGNKHLFSDTFGRTRILRKEDLKNLRELVE